MLVESRDWFDPNDPETPALYREMGEDIVTWFKPDQGWSLSGVSGGLFRFKPDQEARPNIGLLFHLDAQNLPLKTNFGVHPESVDFPQVFAPNTSGRQIILNTLRRDYFGEVQTTKVGPVLPLEQAIEEMSSPFYLLGGTPRVGRVAVNLHTRADGPHYLAKNGEEYSGSVLVTVYARDLEEYFQEEMLGLVSARTRHLAAFPLQD